MKVGNKIDLTTDLKGYRDMDCNEALQLLRRAGGTNFWSWGAHAFTNVKNKALRMMVNGHNHKGHAYLLVTGMDLYQFVLTSTMGTIKYVSEPVYLTEIFNYMDKKIEWIPEYVR